MKKHFALTVLVLVVLSLFISCNNDAGTPADNAAEYLEFKDPYNSGEWYVGLKDEVRSTITSINIPSSYDGKNVTEIYGFNDAVNLESVTIPNTVEYIDAGAFSGCTKLQSIVIPKSVKGIGGSAFDDCTSLSTVTFEEGSNLKWIDRSNAFANTNISSITLPEGLETIGSDTFRGCKNLTSIYIPNSVYQIGSDVCKNINANAVITIDRVKDSIVTGNYHSWSAPSTAKFTWTGAKTTYTVTYNKNGADTGKNFTTEVVEYGTAITVAKCPSDWVREGFTFKCWNTESRGYETNYSPDASYTGPTATFYAIWEENK